MARARAGGGDGCCRSNLLHTSTTRMVVMQAGDCSFTVSSTRMISQCTPHRHISSIIMAVYYLLVLLRLVMLIHFGRRLASSGLDFIIFFTPAIKKIQYFVEKAIFAPQLREGIGETNELVLVRNISCVSILSNAN